MKPILQVDDDPSDVFLLHHAMKKMGVPNPIQVADNGQEAIDYLQGFSKFADREEFPFPCLVLLDLKLPYVMGLEVLRTIRTKPGMTVPIVILSASAQESDITAAYRLGANGFLTKPSEASKLEDMVKAIQHFWLTHNTVAQESSPESPMEGVVSLGRFPARIFPEKQPAPVNGMPRREEWPRDMQATG